MPKSDCAVKLQYVSFGTGQFGVSTCWESLGARDLPTDGAEAAAWMGAARVVSLQSWRVFRVFQFPSVMFLLPLPAAVLRGSRRWDWES